MQRVKQNKWLAVFLSFALVASMLSCMAFGASASGAVATIGDQSFETLSAAVSAAGTDGLGTEIVLTDNIPDCSAIAIRDKEITIDLGGHSIGFAKNKYFLIQGGTLNLTGTGRVYEQQPYFAPVMMKGSADENAENYSVVNVGSDVELEGWSGLFIDKTSPNSNYGIAANVYGTLVSVEDITSAGGHGLYVNGSIANTEGSVPKITLDGAEVINRDGGNGMYLAGYTETVIKNSTITSSVEGSTGIEIRAGRLTIRNSTVTGGSGEFESINNGNGATSRNAGLAVAQHTTGLPLVVKVEGGTFTGGAAFSEANPQKNNDEAVEKVDIEINGGSFDGEVLSEDKEGFISGGEFSTAIDKKFVYPGLSTETDDEGNVTIKKFDTVYINGTAGDDANNGEDSSKAVKTLDRAKKLVAENGLIYACGQINVSETETLSNVTVKRAEGYHGKIFNVDGSWGANGDVEFTMTGVTVDGENNEDTDLYGYLVMVTDGAVLNIEEGTQLINNKASAVYVNHKSFFNMYGGLIKNNDSREIGGGGIKNCGTTVVYGGEISENKTDIWGGGILCERGSVTLDSGVIKNNSAANGAGIAVVGEASAVLNGADITGNTADDYGGGVYVQGLVSPLTDEGPALFEMKKGSITGNKVENGSGAGIFVYYYDNETIARISDGTIADNESGGGEGNAFSIMTNSENDYPTVEFSGSPDIAGDVLFCDYLNPGGYKINVTGEFDPSNPIEINRYDSAADVAVEYAAGLTPSADDFVSGALSEILVIDGQTMKWADASIIYFYDENGDELRDYRTSALPGSKIQAESVPNISKAGYTLNGWFIKDTENAWDFEQNTVGEDNISLQVSWNLNAPSVSVTADTLTPHEGDKAVLTASASHEIDGVQFQYQWYKDGSPIDGETGAVLNAGESGSYTVKVKAVNGDDVSEEIETAAAEIAVESHTAGTEWKSDGDKHWNECTVCGEKMNEADHSFEWVVTEEPTETEAGLRHEECTVCGYAKEAVEIPATGTGSEGPSETDPSGSDDQNVSDDPKMGDSGYVYLLFGVMAAAFAGAALSVAYGRRKKSSK